MPIAIYGPDGRLDGRFLLRTKEALPGIAELTGTLQEDFPLVLGDAATGISRAAAHMHLLYHQVRSAGLGPCAPGARQSGVLSNNSQCIILATRPLLFCLLKLRLDRGGPGGDPVPPSPAVQGLVQMCLDSCSQVIRILECLQHQELLGEEPPPRLPRLDNTAR